MLRSLMAPNITGVCLCSGIAARAGGWYVALFVGLAADAKAGRERGERRGHAAILGQRDGDERGDGDEEM